MKRYINRHGAIILTRIAEFATLSLSLLIVPDHNAG